MDAKHEGGCLCGAVGFAIDVDPTDVSHCHCGMCRKAHGAAFATYCNVSAADHAFTRGQGALKTYRSSDTVDRTFCGQCGAPMLWVDAVNFPGVVAFPLAALDGDFPLPAQRHIFVGSKAPWDTICDAWPQEDTFTP